MTGLDYQRKIKRKNQTIFKSFVEIMIKRNVNGRLYINKVKKIDLKSVLIPSIKAS